MSHQHSVFVKGSLIPIFSICCTLLISSSPALSADTPLPGDNPENATHHVVIISIDGFPAWYLWDERIPLPTIRKLANNGVYATAMIPSNPTLTWVNHTSMLTGAHPSEHGLLFNGKLIRGEPGDPLRVDNRRDRDEMIKLPTVYDIAFEAGLITADSGWPATQNAGTLTYTLPGAVDNIALMTPILRSDLAAKGLFDPDLDSFWGHQDYPQVRRDYIWKETATHLVRQYQPHLLLYHILNADATQHLYGEGSVPGHLSLVLSDKYVKEVLLALEDAGIRDRTTIFLVSDHGFMNIDYTLKPNVLLRKNGLLEIDEQGTITRARVQVVPAGGAAAVFALEPDTRNHDIEEAKKIFTNASGIARIITPDAYERFGLPVPEDSDQVPDFYLEAEPHHSFSATAHGDTYYMEQDRRTGTHGFFHDRPEMETLFVASGYGIRSGVRLETVDNRVVAPTVACLLGLPMPTATVSALLEVLTADSCP